MGSLLRNFLHPLWHWARRDGVNRAIKELEFNQWLKAQELWDVQQEKLAQLLSFACKNVPYYRELLRENDLRTHRSLPEDLLLELPPLTKNKIRNDRDALLSEDLTRNGLLSNSTSGSTGEALRFYTDLRSLPYRTASLLRSDSWTGWRLGDRVVRLWGAPIDESAARNLRGRLHGWVTRDRFLSSFELSAAKMDEYIRKIRDFRPILLVTYPGPGEQFALHCRRRGVKFGSLKAMVSSAETLSPDQRKIMETAFGVRVYNRYGSREVAQIASECEAQNGLHISVDRHVVEVVDDDGRRCPTGKEGRILVTDLDNFGMPLIRYEIGDRGVLAEQEKCSCGRELPKLLTLAGRTMDIIRTPNGGQIGGTFWTLLLKSRPGLGQIQVIQNRLDGVIINYVRDRNLDSAALEYFTKKIQEHCGTNFSVEFVEKEVIHLTDSGKQRLIVSNIKSGTRENELNEP